MIGESLGGSCHPLVECSTTAATAEMIEYIASTMLVSDPL
jgi:hypothetical protein